MLARKPDIKPDEGKIVWSKIPEFSIYFTGGSPIIPHVEHYLNNVMHEIRQKHCDDNSELAEEIDIFIAQEAIHANIHRRFNLHLRDSGYTELRQLSGDSAEHFRKLRKTRSLAFNAAFCAGFECQATFAARYIFETCEEFFEDAEPDGANLLLWHISEEFEHRASAHRAFHAVSNNYFTRVAGLMYAFYVIGGYFKRGEALMLKHYHRAEGFSRQEIQASKRRSRKLHIRLLTWMLPRISRILLPGYDPAKLHVPRQIEAAWKYYDTDQPLEHCFDVAAASRSSNYCP